MLRKNAYGLVWQSQIAVRRRIHIANLPLIPLSWTDPLRYLAALAPTGTSTAAV